MRDLLNASVAFLTRYGYLESGVEIESFDDIAMVSATAKYQQSDVNVAIGKIQMGGKLDPDGIMGPATAHAMSLPRCNCPDIPLGAAPAQGSGSWKGCHGVGNFHKAIVDVNRTNIPNFLVPHFREVLKRSQKSYADLGMLFVFRDADTHVDLIRGGEVSGRGNIDFSFTRGSGWIGLAIVGHGQTCTSNIWCRYDYRYQPADIVTEWTTLVMHELGHNCSLQHTRGGIMNPGVINGLLGVWSPDDPATKTLKRLFGGSPIDIGGDGPVPPPEDGDWPAPGELIGNPITLPNGRRVQLITLMGGDIS